MKITSKAEFYRLMERGCLGNTLRNWRTAEEALKSDCKTFGIREIGTGGGGRHEIVPREYLDYHIDVWERSRRKYIIDEAAPDTDVVLQGEVCRTFRGWEGLLGVKTGRRMRESIRLGLLRPCLGVATRYLLRTYLDASSLDDLDAILDLYPDATVELASYPYDLGKIPGRNTIIWEVRCY